MLQKSKSKSIAKFKYLIMVPLITVMLTYVSCTTQENSSLPIDDNSISAQADRLKAAIEGSGDLSKEETLKITELTKAVIKKTVEEKFDSNFSEVEDSSAITIYEQIPGVYERAPDYPFAVIDEVPVFPGCENLASNKERKDCMSSKVADFVSANFNTSDVKPFSEKGVNRVIVQFRINTEGNVVDVKSRASSPELEIEAKRVINSLPQMQPGKQNGEAVNVMYSLPIVFQVDE